VAQALESHELTVVMDAFLTDTARCADVILPTTTMLEDDDLLGSYGHHWIAESRPVVAPPPEVKTDYEIVQALAPRVGLANDFSEDVDTWKRRLLERVSHGGASLDNLRRGPVRDPLSTKTLFADRKFATGSGKANLIHDACPEPPGAICSVLRFTGNFSLSRYGIAWELREVCYCEIRTSCRGFRTKCRSMR